MAIDTQSLSQLIADFRKLTIKDSVSPDSLGYILQRIADLLATAGTSETVNKIQTLLDGFKAAGYALTSIAQGQADRNHVYATVGKVSLSDGSTSSASSVFIQQATTERAGAMRAQQVTDLNAARKGVADLQTKVSQLETLLKQLQSEGVPSATSKNHHISCEVVDGYLKLHGIAELVKDGYVPYLFRWTRKRNQYHHRAKYRKDGDAGKKYCQQSKGWHCLGSRFAVSLDGNMLLFSTGSHAELHQAGSRYTGDPLNLIHIHTRKDGKKSVAWGRAMVKLSDRSGNPRMIRLRYAVGFAWPLMHGHKAMRSCYMVSNLAEFSLVYDPKQDLWRLSK